MAVKDMQLIEALLEPMKDKIREIISQIKTLKNSLNDHVSIIKEISFY